MPSARPPRSQSRRTTSSRAKRLGQQSAPTTKRKRAAPQRRANQLDGKRWLQNSISVWSDIRKTADEQRLGHPAMFPQALVTRVIETFLPPGGTVVLDPFAGSGSTIVGAAAMGHRGLGLELSPDYAALGRSRLATVLAAPATPEAARSAIHELPATKVSDVAGPATVDLCLTSPPYWNILNQRRTADGKAVRHYGNLEGDLGTIADYEHYLDALADVFSQVLTTLKPGAYCAIVVMDLRKKDRFYPLHSDLAARLTRTGYLLDDLIIWNRQSEYNNLRPLGYPSVFRVNKVHEFVIILQKPRT